MSVNPIISPLKLAIKPSQQKWVFITLPHALGMLILFGVNTFPLLLKVSLLALISLSFTYYLRLHLIQKLDKSVLSIQQDSAKNWFITTDDKLYESEPKSVELLPSSFISNALIVLNNRDNQGSNHSILITPDSLSTNEFRHLFIRIKLTNIKKS